MTDEQKVDPATRFDPRDAPLGERLDGTESIRNHYKRLRVWNQEDRNGKWMDEKKAGQDDRKAILDAIAGQLDLTNYQKERAWYLLQEVRARTIQGNSNALISFCVCAIACEEDNRIYRPRRDSNDELFVEIADRLAEGEKAIERCYYRIREQVK